MLKIELDLELVNKINTIELGKYITDKFKDLLGKYTDDIKSVGCSIYSDELDSDDKCTCESCKCCDEIDDEELDQDDDELDSDVEYIDLSEIETDILLEEIRNRLNESTNE